MAKTATHITVDGERYDLQDAELAQDVSDLKSAAAKAKDAADDAQETADEALAKAASIPNAGSVSATGAISFKHDTTELFTVQLPIYSGGVTNG